MIQSIIIAILSGIISTITIWSLEDPISINSIYAIALTTFWTIFLMSITEKRKYYFIGSIIGLIITYYMIRSQMFISKSDLREEIIWNRQKLVTL